MRRFWIAGLLVSGLVGCQGLCGRKQTTANAVCPPVACPPVACPPVSPGQREILMPANPPPSGPMATPTPFVPPPLNPAPTQVPPPLAPPFGSNYPPGGPIASVESPPPPPPPADGEAKLGSPFDPVKSESTSRKIAGPEPSSARYRPRSVSPPTAGLTGVTAGRRPDLDALDELAQRGVKTAVYLHAPTRDPSIDRRQLGARGVRLIAIAVAADRPSADAVRQFQQVITAPSLRPLHVYDDDGVAAGMMWYVHFRQVDRMNDEAARVMAARLGWPDDQTERAARALKASRQLVEAGP